MLLKLILYIIIADFCSAQFITTDWKAHDAGKIFQIQTNLWGQGYCHIMPIGPIQTHTFYPKNSTNQYTKWDQNNPEMTSQTSSVLEAVFTSLSPQKNMPENLENGIN